KALLKLDHAQVYKQIAPWKDEVECAPVYKGSSNCYKGHVKSKASFISEKDFDNIWLFTAKSWKHANDCESALRKTREEALSEAKFACNKEVISSPLDEQIKANHEPCGCGEGHMVCVVNYQATFQCLK